MTMKFAVALMWVLPLVSHAAGLDCKKAATPVEKAVCADAELGKLDAQVASAYDAAIAQLSTRGRSLLRKGQRQWLGYRDSACAGQEPNCLNNEYRLRLRDLQDAARHVGPFLFSRIDEFDARRRDEEGRPVQIRVSAPRIDAPLSPAAVAWNAAMVGQMKPGLARDCESAGDEYDSFQVIGASKQMISVDHSAWAYCHGTPHGHGGTGSVNLLLTPKLHAMVLGDLFGHGDGWQQVLQDHSLKVLRAKNDQVEFDEAQVRSVVTRLDHWTLSPDGLRITLNPYEVASYAFGNTEVIVPWADLKPYLALNAPLPDAP